MVVKSCFACTIFNCPYHPDYNGQSVPLELECDKIEYYTKRSEFMAKLNATNQYIVQRPVQSTEEKMKDIDILAEY